MSTRYFFALLLLACTTTAHARFGFGPVIGLNISNYNERIAGKRNNTEVKLGGRLGVLFEFPLGDHLALQPGLNYVTNGYKGKSFGGDIVWIINTVELPVNLEYKLGDSCRSSGFFFGGGPYVGYNKGGMLRLKSGINVDTRRDIYVGSAPSDDVKRFDFGFGLNAGYQVTPGLWAKVHYQMGFLNLMPAGDDNNSLRNYNFGLTIGYLFYTKHKEKHKLKEKDGKIEEKYKEK